MMLSKIQKDYQKTDIARLSAYVHLDHEPSDHIISITAKGHWLLA